MKVIRLLVLFGCMFFCLVTTQAKAYTYSVDDGTGEDPIGISSGGSLIWMNQFNAVAGANNIKSVEVVWGLIENNTSATIKVWTDPNNDGNPSDRSLLTSLSVLVFAKHLDDLDNNFIMYDTPDVVVTGSFFVGVEMINAAMDFPAMLDGTTTMARSWVGGVENDGDVIPLNLIDTYGFPGNWMIRAEAGAVNAVPEPTTMLLLGLGLIGLAGVRRKMQG